MDYVLAEFLPDGRSFVAGSTDGRGQSVPAYAEDIEAIARNRLTVDFDHPSMAAALAEFAPLLR